jgi:hypothetical protein
MLEITIGTTGAVLSEGEEQLLLVKFTELKQQEQRDTEEAVSLPMVGEDDGAVVMPSSVAAPTMASSGAVLLGELVRVAGALLVEKRKSLNAAESNNQTMKNMQQMFKSLMSGGGSPGELPPWLKGKGGE